MKTIQQQIHSAIDTLHFKLAITLLNTIPQDQKDAEDWMNEGNCYAACYEWTKAKEDYFQALATNPSPAQKKKIHLRLVSLFTHTGDFKQANKWYQEVLSNDDPNPFDANQLYSGAILDYESGNLQGALALVDQLAHSPAIFSNRIRCEAWTLCGDLYSALGEFQPAVDAYYKSLEFIKDYPVNWQNLRKALVLNNLADIYEQFELYDQAEQIYQQAWEAMMLVDDLDIFDLDGYRLEILVSMANFYTLIDETQQAKNCLDQANIYVQHIEMPRALYWQSRIHYIDGLAELYTENPKYNPFEKIFAAWQEQSEYLTYCPAASKEYLARAAYYAAYCYDENLASNITQEELYLQALFEFKRCSFKDPKFFLFCIASIENELGNIEHVQNTNKAEQFYGQAITDFEHYLKRWPEDQLAYISLTTAYLNYLGVASLEQLSLQGGHLLDRFMEILAHLYDDEQMQDQAILAAQRVLDIESLYPTFINKLEQIHHLYCEQPFQ